MTGLRRPGRSPRGEGKGGMMLTRSQLDTERLARPQHRVSHSHTRRLLVDLDSRLVSVNSNDLCRTAREGGS